MDDNSKLTPLHRAVWRNDLKVVNYLISQGGNVDLQINGGHTAIMWAAKRNHLEMLIYLLDK